VHPATHASLRAAGDDPATVARRHADVIGLPACPRARLLMRTYALFERWRTTHVKNGKASNSNSDVDGSGTAEVTR